MNDWIIYYDAGRMLWDAQPDDGAGAVGSNWQPTTKQSAEGFIREMESTPGFHRGHWNAPRF